jgi:CheY-like chemotaxis protein
MSIFDMNEKIATTWIQIIPSLLWVAIGILVILLFYKQIRMKIPNMSQIKAFGVEATFVKEALDQASKAVPAGDDQSRSAVARRAERLAQIIVGARVLIVNDVPDQMYSLIQVLRSLKMIVDISTKTDDALVLLKNIKFDVVLLDMSRHGTPDEGIHFLRRALELNVHRPTIFTVGQYDPSRGTPAYAFAITDRLDILLHYIFDVLERTRG